MRVHGKYRIQRRGGLDPRPYSDYEPELREDFHNICGYCGKSEAVSRKGFEIDHFIPKSLAKDRVNSYENLVYSCFTCNRKKGAKWPTEDVANCHNGCVGFCDPATDEYDTHLKRDDNGRIISCSPVGEYMLKKAFHFNRRPTEEIWKAMRIVELKKELRLKWSELKPEEQAEYVRIDAELEELLGYIFEKKE